MKNVVLAILFSLMVGAGSAQDRQIIHLWPGDVQGENEVKHEAKVTDNRKGNVTPHYDAGAE